MGAQGSKPDVELSPGEQTFFSQRDPVAFSEDLVSRLQEQSLPSSAVPTSRQEALDAHIQHKIASELARLREQEHQVRDEIERALEKENLDRERGAAKNGEGEKELSHSASLLKDLEDLEKRSAGLRRESEETSEWKSVEIGKEALVKCFKDNKTTPLNCREQAQKFKDAVAGVEKAFFASASVN